MKRKFVLSCIVLISSVINAQEYPSVTDALRKKYNYVLFESVYNADPNEPRDYFYYVGENGKYGACNIKGKEIISPQYQWVGIGRTDEKPYNYFFTIIKNEKYGICNAEGKEIISPTWDAALHEGNDYFIVYNHGGPAIEGHKEGLYDSNGKMILPCEYEYINDYKGVILTKKKGLYGMTEPNGRFILHCDYSKIEVYDSLSIAVVKRGGKCNKDGSAYNPHEGKWGIVTMQGKFIVPCEYDYIGKYAEGLFICNKGATIPDREPIGGLWGYMDTKGTLIIPCKYEEASKFEDGVAQVTLNGVTSLLTNPLTGTTLQLANGNGSSKVDTNIPETGKSNEDTFAFVFANENYNNLKGADYSINDGKVFKEYCKKTLGVPEKNIRYYEDATYGNFVSAVKKVQDIADVYEGDAKIIFYYSGLGMVDSKSKEKYILPVDASIDALSTTGYSLQNLIKIMGALNTKSTLIILDAPFSGSDKVGNMLASARGVRIAPKETHVAGKVILVTSSSNSETAYSDKKYAHGLFTYALLEKLQSTKGNCTISDAMDSSMQWVRKESMNLFDNNQSPVVTVSDNLNTNWKNIKW